MIFVLGCTSHEISEIEIVLIDEQQIQNIIKPENSDSAYIEYPKRKNLWSIEHYFIKPNKENTIFRDSTGNIVAYFKRINGKNYSGGEFYKNGQIMGNLSYSEHGVIDGTVKYYYEDGRIRSQRKWENDERIGTWKSYDENGLLVSVEEYDDNGKLLNHHKIKTNRTISDQH